MFEPEDLGPTTRVTAFTLTGVSTAVVAVRFYCRFWVVGRLKHYDYVMLAALIGTWGLCVVNHYQLLTGTGKRMYPNAPPEPEAEYNKRVTAGAITWFVYRILYIVVLGLIKLSILIFYLTFATDSTFRNLVKITIGLVTAFTVITGFFNGFECPTDPSITLTTKIFQHQYASQCLNRKAMYYAQAAFNIASDAFILVLPLPSLSQLRMPGVKKASLLGVFSAGLLVPIASALRIWALYLWAHSGSQARYYGAYLLFWSQVEINTAILCASAPSLQPLLKSLVGRLVSRRTRSAYYYYGEGTHNMAEAGIPVPQRRGRIPPDSISGLELPPSAYNPSKDKGSTFESQVTEIGLAQERDEEQELRDRVRRFASQTSSLHSHGLESPQHPREMLMAG